MAQRGHQPFAGPSSPPRARRSQQQTSRPPRRAEDSNAVDYSGYGYGKHSEFGAKRPGPAGQRHPPNGTSFPNGHASAFASMQNGAPYAPQYYARSGPLPATGAQLPLQQGYPTPPPSEPRSLKRDSPRLQVLPGSNSLYMVTPPASKPVNIHASSAALSPVPPPPSSDYQPPPPPPSDPAPSTFPSNYKQEVPSLSPPHSSSSLATKVPSAPRAMLNSHSSSASASITINVSSKDASSIAKLNRPSEPCSPGIAIAPTVESLARAALAKPSASSPTAYTTPATLSTNGQATSRKGVMSIAIAKPPGPKIAYPARAVNGQIGANKAKIVNVFELAEKKKEQERQEKVAIKEAAATQTHRESVEGAATERGTEGIGEASGSRYTPPPRNRASRWDRPESIAFQSVNNRAPVTDTPCSFPRSHTPPRSVASEKQDSTESVPPPPPSEAPDSPPPPPPPPLHPFPAPASVLNGFVPPPSAPASSNPLASVRQEGLYGIPPTSTPSLASGQGEVVHISISLPSHKGIKAEDLVTKELLSEDTGRHSKPFERAEAEHPKEALSQLHIATGLADAVPTAAKPIPRESNWYTIYDPKCDRGPVKRSKGPIIRYAGKGVERPINDPRQGELDYDSRLADLKARKAIHNRNKPISVTYKFDENSCGPPPLQPPSAILVTGLTVLTTIEKVRVHFASYGIIEEAELKVDDRTGGSLGICWIKYTDSIVRTVYTKEGKREKRGSSAGQDGNACAKLAVQRSNNLKLPTLAGNDGRLKVALDGQGELCKRQVKAVLDRKRGIVPIPAPVSKRSQNGANVGTLDSRLVAHASLPTRPSPLPDSLQLSRSPEMASHQATGESTLSRRPESGARTQEHRPRDKTPVERDFSQRRSQAIASPARAREPYRLPTYASRGQRDEGRREPDQRSERARSAPETDSESGSDVDSEDAINRKLRDDDEVYGPGTRRPRRLHPPIRPPARAPESISISARDLPVQISSHYRLKIDAYKRLAKQEFPYLVIEKRDLAIFISRGQRVNDQLVKAHFGAYTPKEVFEDSDRFYATFRRSDGANKAYYACGNKKMLQIEVPMRLNQSPPTPDVIEALIIEAEQEARRTAKPTATTRTQAPAIYKDAVETPRQALSRERAPPEAIARDIILEARAMIIRDLRTAFDNDLRKRLAAVHIANGWTKHETYRDKSAASGSPSKAILTKPLESRSPPKNTSRRILDGVSDVVNPSPAAQVDVQSMSGIARLPSFGRQGEAAIARSGTVDEVMDGQASTADRTQPRGVSPAAMLRRDKNAETTVKNLKRAKPQKTKSIKKKSKSFKVEQLHFTSSEEDEGEVEVTVPDRTDVHSIEPAGERESCPDLEKVKIEEDNTGSDVLHIVIPDKAEEQAPLEAVIALPTPTASEPTVSSAKREPSETLEGISKRVRLASPTLAEPLEPKETVADESTTIEKPAKAVKPAARKAPARGKAKGRRGAKQKKKVSVTSPPQVSPIEDLLSHGDQEDYFYLKLALARMRAGQSVLPAENTIVEEEEEAETEELEVVDPRHETGCARTEGYYKISQPEKLRYLLARNQAKEDSAKESNSSLSISRLARVNARHLASGLDKHKKATATDTDLLQLNQLRTRKKQLRFARSPIHDWGLYALEFIPAGEMVIEYVGEQIRQQVADKREKGYERQGIGSSYLFRVDDDVVIDATMKGNLGRLINHCCTPNCTAKILSVGNSKKIVIYAKQVINKGDEITYDYHFPIEDEKIVCLCGSSGCRGFLN